MSSRVGQPLISESRTYVRPQDQAVGGAGGTQSDLGCTVHGHGGYRRNHMSATAAICVRDVSPGVPVWSACRDAFVDRAAVPRCWAIHAWVVERGDRVSRDGVLSTVPALIDGQQELSAGAATSVGARDGTALSGGTRREHTGS